VFDADQKEDVMYTSTRTRSFVSRLVVTAAFLLLVASAMSASAFAGGEPKNEWPFTRHVATRSVQSTGNAAATTVGQGEAKNELPFTRPVAVYPDQLGAGEQKNELPFTATVVGEPPASTSGLDWLDALLVGTVVGSLAIGGSAVLLLTRREVPRAA
jgi:hypothetical protein